QSGQHLGAELHHACGTSVGSELGDEDGRQDAERNADRRGDRDHHQRTDGGVAEAATGCERGRRQLAKRRQPQLPAAPRYQEVEDGEERDEREDRHRPGEHAHRPAEQRARASERALHVGEVLLRRRRRRRYDHRSPLSAASARCTMAVPTTFTIRVIVSSTSAAYMSAPTSTPPASGKWLASSAASVFAGENI